MQYPAWLLIQKCLTQYTHHQLVVSLSAWNEDTWLTTPSICVIKRQSSYEREVKIACINLLHDAFELSEQPVIS